MFNIVLNRTQSTQSRVKSICGNPRTVLLRDNNKKILFLSSMENEAEEEDVVEEYEK